MNYRGVIALLVCAASVALSQEISGTVRDSVTRFGVSGAAVILLDARDQTLARTTTNERGEFHISAPTETKNLRVVRLGFRPSEIALPRPASGGPTAQLELRIARLPTLLEPVLAHANPVCARRADEAAAFALWQQARAGLLTTLVARETNPADAKIVAYQRWHDGTSDRIAESRITIDSGRWTTPFVAALSGAEFVRNGFVKEEQNGQRTYYGPDADVLLQDEFQAQYCFSLANGDRSRPDQMGLRFTSASRKRGRVDIDGTLWIDTANRRLSDIDFHYVGLDLGSQRYNPSGHVAFREVSSGVTFVESWWLRIVSFATDATREHYVVNRDPGFWDKNDPSRRRYYVVTEGGGEVARARWPDGPSWHASMGKLHVKTVNPKRDSVAHARVRLLSTAYEGTSDSTGSLVIEDILPGSYTAVILDSVLVRMGVIVETGLQFVAARDSIVEDSIVVFDRADVVAEECRRRRRNWRDFMILGRVVTQDGREVAGARWQIGRVNGRTDDNGRFLACLRGSWDNSLDIRVWPRTVNADVEPPHVMTVKPSERLTIVRVDLPH